MPRYRYRCNNCNKTQTLQHLSSELLKDCDLCATTDTLTKLISTFSTAKKTPSQLTSQRKTAQITEEFIQDSRQDLRQQKIELKENT